MRWSVAAQLAVVAAAHLAIAQASAQRGSDLQVRAHLQHAISGAARGRDFRASSRGASGESPDIRAILRSRPSLRDRRLEPRPFRAVALLAARRLRTPTRALPPPRSESRRTAAPPFPSCTFAPRSPAPARPVPAPHPAAIPAGSGTRKSGLPRPRPPAPSGRHRPETPANDPTSETITALPSPSDRSSVPELSPTVG